MKELASPPTHPVDWLFEHVKTQSKTVVTARTWFDARKQASIKLGAGPEDILCVANGAIGSLVRDTASFVTVSDPIVSFKDSGEKGGRTEKPDGS